MAYIQLVFFSSDNCERIDFVKSNDDSLARRKIIISKASLINKIKRPNCNSYNTSKKHAHFERPFGFIIVSI